MLGLDDVAADDGLDVPAHVALDGLPAGPPRQRPVLLRLDAGEAVEVAVDVAEDVGDGVAVGVAPREGGLHEQAGDLGAVELLLGRLVHAADEPDVLPAGAVADGAAVVVGALVGEPPEKVRQLRLALGEARDGRVGGDLVLGRVLHEDAPGAVQDRAPLRGQLDEARRLLGPLRAQLGAVHEVEAEHLHDHGERQDQDDPEHDVEAVEDGAAGVHESGARKTRGEKRGGLWRQRRVGR